MITHKAKASLAAALLTLTALPAQAQDWTGAYVGASASSHSGTNTEYWDDVPISLHRNIPQSIHSKRYNAQPCLLGTAFKMMRWFMAPKYHAPQGPCDMPEPFHQEQHIRLHNPNGQSWLRSR